MEPVYNITSTHNNKKSQSGLSRNVVRYGTATTPSSATPSSSSSSPALFNPFLHKRRRLNAKQQEIERLAGEATRVEVLTGLTPRDRQELIASAPDGADEEDEAGWVDIPLGMAGPGEEDGDDDPHSVILSDANKTYMTVTNAMYGPTYLARVKRRRRTRTERVAAVARSWELQIEELADAYLMWKASPTLARPDVASSKTAVTPLPLHTNPPSVAAQQSAEPSSLATTPPPAQSPSSEGVLPSSPASSSPNAAEDDLQLFPHAPGVNGKPSPPITISSPPPSVSGVSQPQTALSAISLGLAAAPNTLSHESTPSSTSDHHPPSALLSSAANPLPQTASTKGPSVTSEKPGPPPLPVPFKVEAIAWHWRNSCFQVPQNHDEPANVSLIREGLLSASPLRPSFAISLQSLESYRRLRLHSPRLSIQSFAKSISATYRQPYRPSLRQNISDAYDAYLRILRCVDARIKSSLGFDTPNWRLLNACPPCQYTLDDEPPLTFSSLIALDGNQSLKRFADAGSADTLTFKSDYYISRDDVDKFKDEVKRKKKKPAKGKAKANAEAGTNKDSTSKGPSEGTATNNEPASKKRKRKSQGQQVTAAETAGTAAQGQPASEGEPDETGDAADVALELETEVAEEYLVKGSIPEPLEELKDVLSVCVERWKANAPDHKKGMFECFDESGVFVSVCRHGTILVVCDMVRSGELSKYPLAILSKLQEVFPDVKAVGYDIGCDFETTSGNSSLGQTLRAHFVTPSMHGYAHNRPCQIKYHPKYTVGVGLEDFETCERVFSSSNDCARTTRHATRFHRHQAIHQHFCQWDEDKYASLGVFIRNNYRQALKNIEEARELYKNPKHAEHIKNDDYNKWLAEEAAYLEGLKKEPEEDTLALAYVKALKDLDAAEAEFEAARKSGATAPTQLGADLNLAKRLVKKTYKASTEQLSFHMAVVSDLESQLELQERWTPESPEYKAAEVYLKERIYRLALDTLEARVASRLFELEKAHVPETGYKLRTHILKHLKSRSDAIRTALNAYNLAASRLVPPKPKIKFDNVLDLSFLAEFDLLRDARQDIRSKPWANPAMRMVIDKYSTFLRSEEEIIRLNVETRRLRTWIRDVEAHFKAILAQLTETDPPLAAELADRVLWQHRVHSLILKNLDEVEGLQGFTGISGCGTRKGKTPFVGSGSVEGRAHDSGDDGNGSESESELVEGQIEGLTNALAQME